MIRINEYIEQARAYEVASHEIWEISTEERGKCLKLDWNEATIPPSPKVMDAINELLENNNFFNLYPKTKNERLVELLANYCGLPTENVQYFGSSDSLHEYISKLFLNQYSRLLILSPSYDNFRLNAETCGAEIIFSDYVEGFTFNPFLFEQDIDNYKPTVVYICNPNNPTGNCMDTEYVEYLLKKYSNTLFIIDEAYYEFSGVTASGLVPMYDNIIITRTFSKAFALANFRMGYLLANSIVIQNINKIRNPKNISTFAQVAAEATLSDIEYMRNYVSEVTKSRAWTYEQLLVFEKMGTPFQSKANFLLFKCNGYEIKRKYIEYLKENNIYIRDVRQRPCVYDCVRISVGTESQMHKLIDATKKFYAGEFGNEKFD